MAGLYEIWRDPTRDEDDPDRFRWTCTVLTTEAEDAVGHIHDRMPLMVEPDRWARWLDPTVSGKDDLLSLLVPAAPGRLEAYPCPTLVSNVRNNGPELVEPLPLEARATTRVTPAMTAPERSSTRRTATAGWSPHRARQPSPRCCSATAPAAASAPATWRRSPHDLPRNGITVVLFEQPWRVAGRKVATPPATLDAGLTAAADRPAEHGPRSCVGGRSAGARSAARCAHGARRGRLPGAVLPAAPARPAGEVPARTSCTAARVPTLVIQGERDTMGRPEEFPDDLDLASYPAPTTGFKVPARGPVTQAEAMAIVVEATLEWIVREVTGNQQPA